MEERENEKAERLEIGRGREREVKKMITRLREGYI